MNKKELTQILDKILSSYQNLDSACDTAIRIGFLEGGGPFYETLWKTFETMLSVVEKQLDTDWISWYIWNNQCGSKGLLAKSGGMKKMKAIKNTKDLAELILKK
jgi:hypothetical protein